MYLSVVCLCNVVNLILFEFVVCFGFCGVDVDCYYFIFEVGIWCGG